MRCQWDVYSYKALLVISGQTLSLQAKYAAILRLKGTSIFEAKLLDAFSILKNLKDALNKQKDGS